MDITMGVGRAEEGGNQVHTEAVQPVLQVWTFFETCQKSIKTICFDFGEKY